MSKARDLADLISTGGILADGTVTVSEISDITATAAELNTLDGITASTADLNNVAGINSDVQTQLDLKAPLASPTLTGTVTIGGTTYPTADGTEGQVLTTNGSGAISFADPAGGGSADFVASGTIANGDVVILNSDGTVSVAENTTTTYSSSMSSQTTLYSSSNQIKASAYDSTNNVVIIAYGSSSPTVMAGTVSGTTITFGTPVTYNSAGASSPQLVFDDVSGKVILVFSDGSDSWKGAYYLITLSGTTITLGSKTTWSSARINDTRLVKDTQHTKFVLTYSDEGGNSNYGTARVLTISGSTINFGAATVFEASYMAANNTTVAYDSYNNKILICYQDYSAVDCKGIVGTVSSNTISFGSPTTFNSARSEVRNLIFDTGVNKFVCIYGDNNNSGYGTAIVATVSGTSVSFGTPVVFNSRGSGPSFASYDSNVNKTFLSYSDRNLEGRYLEITVSGTTPSFTAAPVFLSGYIYAVNSVFDTTSKKTLFFYNDVNNYLYYRVYQMSGSAVTSNVTNSNVIGVASEAISDTATGKITINGGINEGQTGLTVNTTYYVADDGSLSTTNNGRKIGKAIATTKLLVNSNMSGDEMNEYLGGLV